jgi:hypothetical protein
MENDGRQANQKAKGKSKSRGRKLKAADRKWCRAMENG